MDFYLPEYDIYIEYFGINKNGEVPTYFKGAAGLNTEGSSVNHTHEFAKNSEMEELPIESV